MPLTTIAGVATFRREAVVVVVVVREYDEARDKAAVEKLEQQCQVGEPGKPSLVIRGDPIARVRNFSSHTMLVAEYGNGGEIVGVIRGCVKFVTTGKRMAATGLPIYVKLAYMLGLRVSPRHRRLGIATKLVQELEEWFRQNGARYSYMATECNNLPSLNLFIKKCNYLKFRSPTVLVQPVHLHSKPLPSDIAIVRVPSQLVESLYQGFFSSFEFFPKDVDHLLSNELNLGTYMAMSQEALKNWNPRSRDFPASFAILSVWNAKEVYTVKVKGVSTLTHVACLGTRVFDAIAPWMRIPSFPNVFKDFGFYFMFGLHMEGEGCSRLMTTLCNFVHNMGRDDGDCRVVVVEIGKMDPVRKAIPHWKKFSWDEDVWCIKRLEEVDLHDDWYKCSTSNSNIFVDPRDL